MKRYKLIDGTDYSMFEEGEVYNENFCPNLHSVKSYAAAYPNDWEEVIEVVETDEEVVNKLADLYFIDEEEAKAFLKKYNEIASTFDLNLTVYELAKIQNILNNK